MFFVIFPSSQGKIREIKLQMYIFISEKAIGGNIHKVRSNIPTVPLARDVTPKKASNKIK